MFEISCQQHFQRVNINNGSCMISHGISLQTSHKVLGHYVIRNVTKFQNCRSDSRFFIGKKRPWNHFDKYNNMHFFLYFWCSHYLFLPSDMLHPPIANTHARHPLLTPMPLWLKQRKLQIQAYVELNEILLNINWFQQGYSVSWMALWSLPRVANHQIKHKANSKTGL